MDQGNTKFHISLRVALIVTLPILLLLLLILLNSPSTTKQKSTVINKETNISKGKTPQINPKKEYKNPFDKDTQYINPFSEYKNPFDR